MVPGSRVGNFRKEIHLSVAFVLCGSSVAFPNRKRLFERTHQCAQVGIICLVIFVGL